MAANHNADDTLLAPPAPTAAEPAQLPRAPLVPERSEFLEGDTPAVAKVEAPPNSHNLFTLSLFSTSYICEYNSEYPDAPEDAGRDQEHQLRPGRIDVGRSGRIDDGHIPPVADD